MDNTVQGDGDLLIDQDTILIRVPTTAKQFLAGMGRVFRSIPEDRHQPLKNALRAIINLEVKRGLQETGQNLGC